MSNVLLNHLLMIKSLVTMRKPPDKEIFSKTHLVKTETFIEFEPKWRWSYSACVNDLETKFTQNGHTTRRAEGGEVIQNMHLCF